MSPMIEHNVNTFCYSIVPIYGHIYDLEKLSLFRLFGQLVYGPIHIICLLKGELYAILLGSHSVYRCYINLNINDIMSDLDILHIRFIIKKVSFKWSNG